MDGLRSVVKRKSYVKTVWNNEQVLKRRMTVAGEALCMRVWLSHPWRRHGGCGESTDAHGRHAEKSELLAVARSHTLERLDMRYTLGAKPTSQ